MPVSILTSRWSNLQQIFTFKSIQAKTNSIIFFTQGPRHHPPVLHSTSVPTATTQQVTQMTSQPWEPSSPCLWCHLSLQHPTQHTCCPSSALMLCAIPFFFCTESLRKNRHILHSQSGETLELIIQRGSGVTSIFGDTWNQFGQDLRQPDVTLKLAMLWAEWSLDVLLD